MTQAILNADELAITPGDITVYNYDGVTREYLSSSLEYLALGIGIPAYSCTESPGESKEDFAICRSPDFTAWEYVADHRGETVYNIETGEEVAIMIPGDYPEGTTTLAPSTPCDTWNGNEWVTDIEAQHSVDVKAAEQQKAALLTEAQATISLWQTELQLGVISDGDKASLIAWMNYIKAVQAVDTSAAPDIIWPKQPEV
ncbi:phage tail fiber assembly protein [Rahnella aquatilis CIP 78.65 = ATCC 33071]|uniref:Caudovirales tail fiber assembly protein n=1 Tax=Rahnella aquatilis (strain ATCC 33071 / DSM 4594 / JCM 1683 / NBRC 105701 / NCIMB 13365 / CIP 78.65) TaxID=745277 RepID=H2IY39_RAHAC|nr:tail fiber assembly protein [Rahnella aquatilis]AEX53116.1 Caudovirales tail fiber assembly protein [Rahnella aquatilis CIP 78.65 = ATCC 33071]KFD04524.1 phage tail fiber assembly protein [Rahnella aquatilis CIP 78.65 = ATCC 33071]